MGRGGTGGKEQSLVGKKKQPVLKIKKKTGMTAPVIRKI